MDYEKFKKGTAGDQGEYDKQAKGVSEDDKKRKKAMVVALMKKKMGK